MNSPLEAFRAWYIQLVVVALAVVVVWDILGVYRLDDYTNAIVASFDERRVEGDETSWPVHWAVGSLEDVEADDRRWFATTGEFDERPWWRYPSIRDDGARGQTVSQFRESEVPPVDDGDRVYLQPLVPPSGGDGPRLEPMAELLEVYFQMPVTLRAPLTYEQLSLRGRELDSGRRQLKTGSVGDGLAEMVPDDAYAVIGITATDLYPDDSWAFVFGQAWPARRVGVASFARLDAESDAVTRERRFKIVAHELGHVLGMTHCLYFRCIMNAGWTLDAVDRGPVHLGPVDLRKLHDRIGFDPEERYRELGRVYRRQGMDEAAEWIERRVGGRKSSELRVGEPPTPPER
jgi:archaemetzincin